MHLLRIYPVSYTHLICDAWSVRGLTERRNPRPAMGFCISGYGYPIPDSTKGKMCIRDRFKDRENTVIGSKGVYLSGGEKQRIAIARAMLKNAKIVILDEASAAIDPENEHELQKAFAHLMKGKTVIMIAHRLSSIRNVDEILVFEDGKIAERGTDAALMATDTKYREYQTLYEQANEWRVVR